MNYLKDILYFIFPVTCAVCGRCLPSDDRFRICGPCREEIKFIDLYCGKCGKPLLYGGAHCYRCLKTGVKYSFESIRSVCLYDGKIKEIIHSFKYSGKEYLGEYLNGLLAGYIRGGRDFPSDEIDSVVPVPLHWSRKFKRGYNQAEILAGGVAGVLKKELVPDAVVRIKPTKPQFGLSREERFENTKGVFSVRKKGLIKDKVVLLVDDVCTTGSTFEGCSHALKSAGAAKIYGLTLAHG